MSSTETHQYVFSTDDVDEYKSFLEFVSVFDKKEGKKSSSRGGRRSKKDDDEDDEKPQRGRGGRGSRSSKKKDDAFEVPSRPNKTNTKALLNRFTEECGDKATEELIADWRIQDNGIDDLEGKEFKEICEDMFARYEELQK